MEIKFRRKVKILFMQIQKLITIMMQQKRTQQLRQIIKKKVLELNIGRILGQPKHMITQQSLHPTHNLTIIETVVICSQCIDLKTVKVATIFILKKAIHNREIRIYNLPKLSKHLNSQEDRINFITKESRKVLSRLIDKIKFKQELLNTIHHS